MKTLPRLLALSAIVALAALSSVASADAALPDCPDETKALQDSVPDFLRVGKSFVVETSVSDGHAATEVSALSVSFLDQVVPLTLAGDQAQAVFAGPTETGPVTIRFDWEQNLGTTTACHGVGLYEREVIPATAKAGDPSLGRLEGEYELTARRSGSKGFSGMWTLRPRCDVFGCSTMLVNSGGSSGHVLKPSDGHYRVKMGGPAGGKCRLRYASGRKKTISPAYNVSTSFDLRVTETDGGVATRLSGTETTTVTPTTRARRAGCGSKSTTVKYKLTVVRE